MGAFLDLIIVAVEADNIVTLPAEGNALIGIGRPVMIVKAAVDICNVLLKLANSTAAKGARKLPVPAKF